MACAGEARGGLLRDDAREASQSYLQRGFELFISYDLDLDLLGATQRLTLSPFVGINWTDYREANPLVDPDGSAKIASASLASRSTPKFTRASV